MTKFISIHAAREGGDYIDSALRHLMKISIHAAREGGDEKDPRGCYPRLDFNPRRP